MLLKKFIWFFATFCHSGKTTLLDCLLLFHVQYQVCVREVTLGCHDKNLNLAVRAAEVIFCNVFHKISHISTVFLYQQVGGLLLQLSFVPLAWGPELGWDPRSILTVAEKSRVVTSLHLLFFFYLLSSLSVSHCRGRWFTRVNSSSSQTWSWCPWRRLHCSGSKDWKQIIVGLSQSYCLSRERCII